LGAIINKAIQFEQAFWKVEQILHQNVNVANMAHPINSCKGIVMSALFAIHI